MRVLVFFAYITSHLFGFSKDTECSVFSKLVVYFGDYVSLFCPVIFFCLYFDAFGVKLASGINFGNADVSNLPYRSFHCSFISVNTFLPVSFLVFFCWPVGIQIQIYQYWCVYRFTRKVFLELSMLQVASLTLSQGVLSLLCVSQAFPVFCRECAYIFQSLRYTGCHFLLKCLQIPSDCLSNFDHLLSCVSRLPKGILYVGLSNNLKNSRSNSCLWITPWCLVLLLMISSRIAVRAYPQFIWIKTLAMSIGKAFT